MSLTNSISSFIEKMAYDYTHFLTATTVVSWGYILGKGHGSAWASAGVLVFALAKEFYWDLRYETPVLSGGYLGGLRDFAGYLVGVASSLSLLKLLK